MMRRFVFALAAFCVIAQAAPAPPAKAPSFAAPSFAKQAFASFRSLQGQWSIIRNGKPRPYTMNYDTASKDSVVTEQFGHELSVFYLDGNRLLMTHFCNAGNQPRLQLRPSTTPGVADFVMIDITGLDDPRDAHVQEVIYRMIDERTIALSIIWTGGRSGAPEQYTLIRRP